MKEIAISKFKATCLAVMEEVQRTRKPVRVTRRCQAMADVVPCIVRTKGRLGCMRDSVEILGDIVGPTGAFDGWTIWEK